MESGETRTFVICSMATRSRQRTYSCLSFRWPALITTAWQLGNALGTLLMENPLSWMSVRSGQPHWAFLGVMAEHHRPRGFLRLWEKVGFSPVGFKGARRASAIATYSGFSSMPT